MLAVIIGWPSTAETISTALLAQWLMANKLCLSMWPLNYFSGWLVMACNVAIKAFGELLSNLQ